MSWRAIQRKNFTSLPALVKFLELDPAKSVSLLTSSSFPLNLPYRLAEKIEKNTLHDPILRQFVPLVDEEHSPPSFVRDPLNEAAFRHGGKLLHKYGSRALVITTGACVMHCRYCFRRHFPYEKGRSDFSAELDYLKKETTLSEVILSGGDPLSLSNRDLTTLIGNIERIPHIKRLRIHTRVPLGIPERIDDGLLSLLAHTCLQTWFVIHCNHPKELDNDILHSLKSISLLGIPVLNQSVLLRGINDNPTTLTHLCERLIDHGILPYYLHALDHVEGAHHFATPLTTGLDLISHLQSHLPGYGVPRFVQELPGGLSKSIVEKREKSGTGSFT